MPLRSYARRRPTAVVTEDIVTDEVVTRAAVRPTVIRQPWSPAQAIALGVGFLFTIMGAIALARTGMSFDAAHHVNVAGFHHTAWLGLLEMLVGVCLIGAGAVPGGGRPSMTFFGALLFGFGVVVIAEPNAFHAALGTHSGHGALWAVMGALLLAAAMLSPVFLDRRRAVVDVTDRDYVIR